MKPTQITAVNNVNSTLVVGSLAAGGLVFSLQRSAIKLHKSEAIKHTLSLKCHSKQ